MSKVWLKYPLFCTFGAFGKLKQQRIFCQCGQNQLCEDRPEKDIQQWQCCQRPTINKRGIKLQISQFQVSRSPEGVITKTEQTAKATSEQPISPKDA
jgi:hypothetical protein